MELHDGIRVVGPYGERYDEVLTPEALTFLSQLHSTFEERRSDLLSERGERRSRIAAGEDPDFLAETKHIREDTDWRVARPAPGLEDRRVEMTGPTPDPRAAFRAARPRCSDHDDTVHAGIHRTARPDLSPPRRACDRRYGRVRAGSA